VTLEADVRSTLSDEQWQDLLTPRTPLHERWCAQVDVIAGFLSQLREARVPVLWRPYPELNGEWFWWGGRRGQGGSAALYRQLFERCVHHHGLDNLLWVWNCNARDDDDPASYADHYPGHDCVDVLTVDVHESDYQPYHHDEMLALGADKPIALGEVSALPPPELFDSQPRWVWFLVWGERLALDNTLEQIRAIYHHPRTLTLHDPRFVDGTVWVRARTRS
jgi:mannan endo-1,4-beta-mannosidase